MIGRLAFELDLAALINRSSQPAVSLITVARSNRDFGDIARDPSWTAPVVGPDVWTDDFSDLLSVIRLG